MRKPIKQVHISYCFISFSAFVKWFSVHVLILRYKSSGAQLETKECN